MLRISSRFAHFSFTTVSNNLESQKPAYTFTFIRHGQSIWNKQKKWAGWTDVPLSQAGMKQMQQCAQQLKSKQLTYDVAYTSMLCRAIKSTNIILYQLNLNFIPVNKQWRLNQKHYGALQGLSKVEINQKHGSQMVNKWRRSMDTPPPPLDRSHQTHPINNPIYKHVDPQLLPNSQSLLDIINRVKPLWQQNISSDLKHNKKVLIVAHGSSLRALAYILQPNMTEQQIRNFNIPNATPVVYSLDSNLKFIKKQYLGNLNQIKQKMNKIKYQAQRKDVQ